MQSRDAPSCLLFYHLDTKGSLMRFANICQTASDLHAPDPNVPRTGQTHTDGHFRKCQAGAEAKEEGRKGLPDAR